MFICKSAEFWAVGSWWEGPYSHSESIWTTEDESFRYRSIWDRPQGNYARITPYLTATNKSVYTLLTNRCQREPPQQSRYIVSRASQTFFNLCRNDADHKGEHYDHQNNGVHMLVVKVLTRRTWQRLNVYDASFMIQYVKSFAVQYQSAKFTTSFVLITETRW